MSLIGKRVRCTFRKGLSELVGILTEYIDNDHIMIDNHLLTDKQIINLLKIECLE